MRFALTETQQEMRELLAEFLRRSGDLAEARRSLDGAASYSDTVWDSMASDLGLLGVAIPEAAGGIGLSDVELALCLEELGAVVYPGPFLATAGFAALALLEVADEAGLEKVQVPLSGIAAGGTAALAMELGEATGEVGGHAIARLEAGQWFLSGDFAGVLQADQVDHIAVPATIPDGTTALFWTATSTASVELASGIDPTRGVCRVSLSQAPAEYLAPADATTLHRILLRMRVALAAECLGAAQRCLDMATSYAKVRNQFGRPIGQFQAIKHRLADLLVEVEMARSCVYAAACHVASRSWSEAELSAPAALAAATSALSRAARDSVQVHGGIAFTWEHDAHLFVRRGVASQSLLGRASALHRDVYDVAGLAG